MKKLIVILFILIGFTQYGIGQKISNEINNETYVREQIKKFNVEEWVIDEYGKIENSLFARLPKKDIDEKIAMYRKRNRVKTFRESLYTGITFREMIHKINTEYQDIKDWIGFTPEQEKMYLENENKFLLIIPKGYKGAYVITHNIQSNVKEYGSDVIRNKQVLKYTEKEISSK